jgi:myo-inositol-1-phosphate synthase
MQGSPARPRPWGLWLVGARGSVATTTTAGIAALARGLAGPSGLVTGTAAFAAVELPALEDVVVGGWDLADDPLPKRAEQLEAGGVLPAGLATAVTDDLAEVDARVAVGVADEQAATAPASSLARLRQDLSTFRTRHDLHDVVVVNVASTEPPQPADRAHEDADALLRAVAADRPVLSTTGLYAVAALTSGACYVEFTPALAATLPALAQLADRHGTTVAGRDGKTGETLLKTALAPMFADRALRVRSWSGVNLLGGGDGATLADPSAAASKLASKAAPLEAILGYRPEGPVRIDNVPDLGDWKTAWDLITFEGFLGTRMQLQLTWQGCDSALAAPLVLDLARLSAAAKRAGHTGVLPALAYFFKAPLGTDEHRLDRQFDQLLRWAGGLRPRDGTTPA